MFLVYTSTCIISKIDIDTSLFTSKINNSSNERVDCIQYLGALLDDKLSWKYHIQKLHKKLSKICELIFKLRNYVPLSTRKLIYYSIFQPILLYSLISCGRATKLSLHQLYVLQNRFIRASLVLQKTTTTKLMYFKFQILKLKYMIKIEIAKFMFRLKDKILSISFDSYFSNLSEIHIDNNLLDKQLKVNIINIQ